MTTETLSCCPKPGDLVLVQGKREGADDNIELYRVSLIKEVGGELEVILLPRKNVWFGWEGFLRGNSWVKEIKLVLP